MPKTNNQVLYLGNLPLSTSESDLADLLSPLGHISYIRFTKNYLQPPKKSTYAFVKLDSLESMEKAISQLDHLFYQEHYLIVKLVDYPPQTESSSV